MNVPSFFGKKMQFVKWSLVFLAFFLVFAGCWQGGLPQQHVLFYSVTSAALVLWAFSLLSDTFVAISLPVIYIMLHLGKPGQILSPWSSPVGWIVLSGIVIATVMMHTGLGKRMAIWALYVTRGSFNRLLWGILLAGFLIAPCIPTVMGKAALISVICISICEALGFEKKSVQASAVILAGFIAVAAPKMAFLTGGADIPLFTGLIATKTGHTISWVEYFLHNGPLTVLYAILSMLTLLLLLRPKVNIDFNEFVVKSHSALGPVKTEETKTAVILAALVLLLLTDRFHGINAAWIMVMLSLVTFLPGIELMDEKKLQKIPFTPVFFVVGCMSIGTAASAVGADKALAASLIPLLEGSGEITAVLLGYLFGTALNFLLTPLAAFSSMTVPLTELAMEMGFNPIPIMYAFSYGLEQYIFPYEFAVLLFFYATGWVALRHIMLVFAVRFFVGLIFIVGAAYPWWNFLGLFNTVG